MNCEFVDGRCIRCGHVARHANHYRDCRRAASLVDDVDPQPRPIRTHGPGTELSKLLKRLGVNPTPTCQCRAMSQKMDMWGCDEASKPERIDEVVAVMRAEAEARGLPFLDVAGRLLVRRAIQNARRAAATTQP